MFNNGEFDTSDESSRLRPSVIEKFLELLPFDGRPFTRGAPAPGFPNGNHSSFSRRSWSHCNRFRSRRDNRPGPPRWSACTSIFNQWFKIMSIFVHFTFLKNRNFIVDFANMLAIKYTLKENKKLCKNNEFYILFIFYKILVLQNNLNPIKAFFKNASKFI